MDLAQEVKQKLVFEDKRRQFPQRPNYLTIGRPQELLTNHFKLKVGNKMAFHYDIEIERIPKSTKKDTNLVDKDIEETNITEKKNMFSRKLATRLNRKIFQSMVESNCGNNGVFEGINPVYDGQKNMFTSKILNGTEDKSSTIRLRIQLTEEYGNSEYNVFIKMAETNEMIDLNIINLYHSGQTCDEELLKKCVLFLNTLLRHNSSICWVPIGQSIFKPEDLSTNTSHRLGKYSVLSFGYYSSVRNLMIGPTLNIDRSATAFYDSSQTIETIISTIINGDITKFPQSILSDPNLRRKIKKELVGLQIEAQHRQYGGHYRKYRILGLSKKSAKSDVFDWSERDKDFNVISVKQISVSDYFKENPIIRKTLRFPHLPCLEVGNANNIIKLPLEVCRLVPHQRIRRQLTNIERSKMTTISGQQNPRQRLDMCQRYVNQQFRTSEMFEKNRPFLSEFEISVSENLLRVNSKVIPPPKLKYKRNEIITPKEGEWQMVTKTGCSRFLKGAKYVIHR